MVLGIPRCAAKRRKIRVHLAEVLSKRTTVARVCFASRREQVACACEKCLPSSKVRSFAMPLQSMWHGINVAESFVRKNISWTKPCQITKCSKLENFQMTSLALRTNKQRRRHVSIKKKLNISGVQMEAIPRKSLRRSRVQKGCQKPQQTGQQDFCNYAHIKSEPYNDSFR